MGDSMKRTAVILGLTSLGIMSCAVWAGAQTSAQPQNPPAAGQAAPGAGATTTPAAKRPPQAKTQPEFDAYKAAAASADAAGLEKASDDFATKFPDSELRVLLYKNAMRLYQNSNNAEKTEAMGRKVIGFDGDDPEALVTVAEVIAERTHDSDIDKDQRYAEAITMAQKATQTVDTDVQVPAGTPQDKLDQYKGLLRSNAYSVIGTIEFKKDTGESTEVHRRVPRKPGSRRRSPPGPHPRQRTEVSRCTESREPCRRHDAGQYRDWNSGTPGARPLAAAYGRRSSGARRDDSAKELTKHTAATSQNEGPRNHGAGR
jgi:hypothetical protein